MLSIATGKSRIKLGFVYSALLDQQRVLSKTSKYEQACHNGVSVCAFLSLQNSLPTSHPLNALSLRRRKQSHEQQRFSPLMDTGNPGCHIALVTLVNQR
jgi:hypothetical protein